MNHRLRAYPNNSFYYGSAFGGQSPMPALSGQNRPRSSFCYACGDFAPAALSSGFSHGLITSVLFGQALIITAAVLTVALAGLCLADDKTYDKTYTKTQGVLAAGRPIEVVVHLQQFDPNGKALPAKPALELEKRITEKLVEAGLNVREPRYIGGRIRLAGAAGLEFFIDWLEVPDANLAVIHARAELYVSQSEESFAGQRSWKSEPKMLTTSAAASGTGITESALRLSEQFIRTSQTVKSAAAAGDALPGGETVRSEEQDRPVQAAEEVFTASKNGKVFHKADCAAVGRIKPANIVYYNTRSEAIEAGKRPCKICKP